jgi:murein DD-endopeptidase MepM/ murein hydrolase activator NlpD
MGIGWRIGALAIVLGSFGCARSGPPAPVVYGEDVRSPSFQTTPDIPAAPVLGAEIPTRPRPVRWATLPPGGAPAVSRAPIESAEPAAAPVPPLPAGRVESTEAARVQVKRGDTLYAISRRHRIPLRALIEANGLKPPYRLATGRMLRVPETRYYVVASGDTVYRVGRRFGVSPDSIIRVNRIKARGFKLYPGQKLLIPGAKGAPAPTTAVARATPEPAKAARSQPTVKPRTEPLQKVALKAPVIAARPAPDAKPKAAIGEKAQPLPKPPVKTAAIPAPPLAPQSKAEPKPKTEPKPSPKLAALPPRAGGFVWPVKGRLLSAYGAKGNGLYNDGINIAAQDGTPVRAVESGIVAYAGNELKGYGNLLLIRHEGGWVSAYAHNSRIMVSKGQVVRRGETVAQVGRTGAVEEPQLHFELRRGPHAVNPLQHLKNGKG